MTWSAAARAKRKVAKHRTRVAKHRGEHAKPSTHKAGAHRQAKKKK